MGKRIATGELRLNRTNVDRELQSVDRKISEQERRTEEQHRKIREFWSYGNQIASVLLTQLQQIADKTMWGTIAQGALYAMQKAQTQITIIQTIAEASAAYAKGNIFVGNSLMFIATNMQTNMIRLIALDVQQRQAENQAADLARQIAAYRSG